MTSVRECVYRKVEVAMWRDKRFRELSAPPPNAQTLWHALLDGERTTILPGLIIARLEVLASDLGWPLEDTRRCWKEIEDKGMATADWDAGVIVLTKALFDSEGRYRQSARPSSPNAFKSWLKSWHMVPECDLTARYFQLLGTYAHALDSSARGGDKYLDIYLSFAPNSEFQVATRTPTRQRPARDPDPDPGSDLPSSLSASGSGDPHRVPAQVALPLAPVVMPEPPRRVAEGTGLHTPAPPAALDSGTLVLCHQHQPHTTFESQPAVLNSGTLSVSTGNPPQPAVLASGAAATPERPPLFGETSDVHARLLLFQDTEQKILAARARLAAELGCANRYVAPSATAQRRFLDRMAKSRDPTGDIDHAIAVVVEEARGMNELTYVGWCMFEEKTWENKLNSDPTRVRERYQHFRQRGSPSPSDVMRDEQRRLDAEAAAAFVNDGLARAREGTA